MRLLPALVLVLVAATGCGGGSPPRSPEEVVRAWSAALNRSDDGAAAALFAPRAQVVQAGIAITLRDREAARRWNGGLPCGGRIVALSVAGEEVTATFELGERPGHRCEGSGREATAVVRVEAGKIVLWHQTDGESRSGPVI